MVGSRRRREGVVGTLHSRALARRRACPGVALQRRSRWYSASIAYAISLSRFTLHAGSNVVPAPDGDTPRAQPARNMIFHSARGHHGAIR